MDYFGVVYGSDQSCCGTFEISFRDRKEKPPDLDFKRKSRQIKAHDLFFFEDHPYQL